jgi:peptidoglycan/LPS O-acetylase OafA/YrhL
MLGSIGAYHINYANDKVGLIPFVRKYQALILIATIALIMLKGFTSYTSDHASVYVSLITSIVLAFFYLFIIIWSCFGDVPKTRIFDYTNRLGAYTYGMYFYHELSLILVRACFDKVHLDYKSVLMYAIISGAIALILNMIISYFSYTYFEKWFLQYKDKFASIMTRKVE